VSEDFEGDVRGAAPDIGADERTTGAPIYGLLSEQDVGPAAP
jgi:hypothetical protein